MAALRIDIWSDIACPWCYIGKRRLEGALREAPGIGQADVLWHAFELDPSAPRQHPAELSYTDRLAKKYGQTREQAQRMIDRLVDVARVEELELRFDRIRPGNTFDAHRLMHHAKQTGHQNALAERLFHAYFSEGKSVADPATLESIASDAGLDAAAIADLLASDLHADAVRADEAEAGRLGIQGVPFFVFDGRLAVSGAQPAQLFSQVIERALRERDNQPEFEEGAACGPSGC
jgi:predicted DsbA family dithiol-disulfide isomerase